MGDGALEWSLNAAGQARDGIFPPQAENLPPAEADVFTYLLHRVEQTEAQVVRNRARLDQAEALLSAEESLRRIMGGGFVPAPRRPRRDRHGLRLVRGGDY